MKLNKKGNLLKVLVFALSVQLLAFSVAKAQQTEIRYLSGTGSDKTVNWQFFCTAGRNSGKWTTIPVPSNWEQQGFGKYNYGHDKDSVRGKEKGLYKYNFTVPASWQGKTVKIVFEGSMTDTEVKINGKPAGAIHQGAFYSFSYDITKLLKVGKKNLLEVTVSKHSANESVNGAERRGDFWILGGIFRPVFLQALPAEHIAHVAVDGKATGAFTARLKLATATADEVSAQVFNMNGERVGSAFTTKLKAGDSVATLQTTVSSPALWTPEFPNRYRVEFTLLAKGKPVHTVQEKFGFRTVEVRERDGIYLNGVKVKFKGVNRHSFWPTTGRAMSEKMSIDDVLMIKDMNMNAVRMSHYPPDAHFLDACDSLGLMVLDELTGWHKAYDTEVGTKLVHEMIAHDVNHPSIVLWDNGNEGGHNDELDHLFDELDIQHRPLVHPWQVFREFDTQHYINWDYGNNTHLHGHKISFPTEFLHGLYDGGLGAGLEDYWESMWRNPLSAGGFLWVFADEGIARKDKNDSIDNDGSHAPDGIVGPYHEKEGSYYTIKEVWAPVHFEKKDITTAFDGQLRVENRYHFTNLNQCRFTFKLASLNGKDSATGTVNVPAIAPGNTGIITCNLPANWQQYSVLYVTAMDAHQREIFTWSWPIKLPSAIAQTMVKQEGSAAVTVAEKDSLLIATAGDVNISFHIKTGLLQTVQNGKGIIPLTNGPILVDSASSGFVKWNTRKDGNNQVISAEFAKKSLGQTLEWTIYPSGWVKMHMKYFPKEYESSLIGVNFSFPENTVKSIQWMGKGPYRVWKNRMKGGTLNVWNKEYNNTSTGEGKLIYPEFKGYYSNLYWMKLNTTGQPLTVVCSSEDIFLRLFTPKFSVTPYNTAPEFPGGDLSFMDGISAIGTKSQKADKTGPMGQKNMFFDYWKDPTRAKELTLFFNFSGKE
ncbi:glycoside hydrolase family 2 protein [Longitalea luteola]|uniref:glycoside hydrolase family 2 protein n=1 Tax=Longitalea luteola TaxID=2812563 RepID=UPI001F601345|nr:glycoside hydrolase family 2 TIM barrel-domain containing protein [Longitalea luteola]